MSNITAYVFLAIAIVAVVATFLRWKGLVP